jgi:glycogen(starch) synthase
MAMTDRKVDVRTEKKRSLGLRLVAHFRTFRAQVSSRRGLPRPADRDDPRPRVLHLGLEDHRRPHSGGGAVRTHEMARRLVDRFDITVVTAKYRGCEDRIEDGVRYVHVGWSIGYLGSMATYHLALPWFVWRADTDLVMDELSAPIGSALIPLWSRAPTVGLVQWLFAREMSRKYHLPFWVMEALALRLHNRFITTSTDLQHELATRAPQAEVVIVPNGIDPAEWGRRVPKVEGTIVFVGRLDVDQKGIDLLLEAFAIVAEQRPARLLIVGDGRDRARVQAWVAEHPYRDSIELLGEVHGAAKCDLLSSAQLVAMPSRYETFGIVALEALAAGSPVVAFSVESLHAIVPPECGVLVPSFDVAAYARATVELLDDPARCHEMGEKGRAFSSHYGWDELSRRQGAVFTQVLTEGAR